ncbi:hypothetical protein [Paenibacillus montaniterrae]|uniref:hypothetical protein n=1 Tax=Paenibacillus montaniterrae TaxID=429341 RepID=UPI001BCAA3FD
MKKAKAIMTKEEIANHFFNGAGIVSFFNIRINPKEKANMIKITLIEPSILHLHQRFSS